MLNLNLMSDCNPILKSPETQTHPCSLDTTNNETLVLQGSTYIKQCTLVFFQHMFQRGTVLKSFYRKKITVAADSIKVFSNNPHYFAALSGCVLG